MGKRGNPYRHRFHARVLFFSLVLLLALIDEIVRYYDQIRTTNYLLLTRIRESEKYINTYAFLRAGLSPTGVN